MTNLSSSSIISCNSISKSYGEFFVLNNFSIEIKSGETVSIIGPSGSGKSTLLHLLALIDTPSSGKILMPLFKEQKESCIRKKYIGFVYQHHFLIDELTVLENIMIASNQKNKDNAIQLLESLNMLDKKDLFPYQLSGGQKQRASIARAVINTPRIIIADEPTGNLDRDNANGVQNILISYAKEKKSTLIVATHDNNFAQKMERIICLY